MLIVLLWSLLFYHQSCFAFNSHILNPDDVRMLAIRVALLEKAIGKEQLNSVQNGGQSIYIDRTNEVPYGTILKSENQHRFQEDNLFLLGQETNNSELKNCDDRILTLERTVRDLSRVVTRQTEYIQNVQRLEARVDEQERVISDSRRRISETENNVQKIESKLTESKGMEIEDSNISNLDLADVHGNGMPEMKHELTNEKHIQSQGNVNKKRLLSPVTTTSLPPLTVRYVAFYAYMSQNTPTISVSYPLRFDVVKTNVGNGYHSTTGTFIVPETGIYVFTWTIRVYGGANRHSTQLIVNTDELGIIHTHAASGADFEGTGIVVIQANAGDDVFLRTHGSWNDGPIISDAAGRSSFAGWKLY